MISKNFIKFFAFILASFSFMSSVLAAEIDHFQVELSPKSVKVWESLDLTIKAVDKNNVVVPNYNWTVLIFSESNPEASMPIILKDSTYTFKDTDQWVIKFENWVKFTKPWNQVLNVFDFENEKIFWKWEVTITESWTSWKQEIEVISPESWLTIWENKIKVSGSTVKNHKVKIIINWENIDSNSNDNGIFEKEIENLKNWENVLKAQVLDANNSVIWETSDIKFKVENSSATIKSIKLIPEEVFVEWPYSIELLSNSWLKEVSVIINDTIINLKEESSWLYKGNSIAPKKADTYKVDINITNEFWKKLNELWVTSLKVKELNSALKLEEPKNSTWASQVIEEKKERDPLKITWLKLVELKTKSILTWDSLPNAKSYNIYKKNSSGWKDLITTVNEPKFEINIEWDKVKFEDFYVSANGEDENWKYEWIISDPTKIKTWPEMLIILLISLFWAWMYFVLKWRKNS